MVRLVMRAGGFFVLLLLSACDCGKTPLDVVTNSLRLHPQTIDFGSMYPDGVERTKTFEVMNDGRASQKVLWSFPASEFVVEGAPDLLPAGNTKITIRFTPSAPGEYVQQVGVIAEGAETGVSATVQATVLQVPDCQASEPCLVSRFDFVRKACVEDAVEDGKECELDTLCAVETRCEAGRCVGNARVCDDGNACTIDVCYPLTGCEFLPRPPCPGDGACLQGVCDPESGCGVAPREDGSSCGTTGETNSCTAVKVCIEGECVTRDPPDGYVCAEASPCEGKGICENDVCVRQGESTLPLTWNFDSAQFPMGDGGTRLGYYHDFVLEPSGAASLSGFFIPIPIMRANTAPLYAQGGSRRCLLWGARYVCADYPDVPSGQVSGVDLSTGEIAWTFSMRVERPDLVAKTANIFLARLVVQGPDRLAAIYEAFPPGLNNDTQCRRYFISVMDANGAPVQAFQVQDPLLDVCNHPHPYGAAADSQGNLYLAFSPTQSPTAPLVPANTTLIMSWSRDGVFRWKRTNVGMRGGELAVARGLLYAEYSHEVVDATSGVPAYALPGELGRAVVSSSRLIPTPMAWDQTLTGYEAGGPQPRWHITLPPQHYFWSDQLRLAKWQTSKGDRTVALTWVEDSTGVAPVYKLHGVDVEDGSQAFMCPIEAISSRTGPQLFEVANGSITMMNGAMEPGGNPGCVKCDPPLAYSSGAFFTWQTPTLSTPVAPWPGTFGGAGHDHRED